MSCPQRLSSWMLCPVSGGLSPHLPLADVFWRAWRSIQALLGLLRCYLHGILAPVDVTYRR